VLKDWHDLTEAYEYLRHTKDQWDWVWLDSISLMQDYGLDHIWSDTLARNPERGKYGLDKGEYGVNIFRLGQWVRHMVGLEQFNFGITAHPFETQKVDGSPVFMPWVQGRQMSNKVCGYMNLVAYMDVEKPKNKPLQRVLHTEQTGLYYAKDQIGNVLHDGAMVNPTMPKFMARIDEVRNSKSAPATRRTQSRPRSVGGQGSAA
jgi:hypothetical protein